MGDSDWCLALCQMIAGECKLKKPVDFDTEIVNLKAQIEAFKPLEKAVLAIQSFLPPQPPKISPSSKGEPKKNSKKAAAPKEEEKPPLRQKGGPGKGKGKGKGKNK